MSNKTVSIRELKSRLSEYLRIAREGGSVIITDRGTPVGRIVPFGRDLDQRIEALCDSGQAQWSGKKFRPRKPVATARGNRTVSDLLLEDRG